MDITDKLKERQNMYGFQEYINEFKNIPCSLPDNKIEAEPVDELNNKIEQYKVIETDENLQENPINILNR